MKPAHRCAAIIGLLLSAAAFGQALHGSAVRDREQWMARAERVSEAELKALYLRAEDPARYGNKVKVEVDHRYQLKPEDDGVGAEIRGQLGRRPKPVQLLVEDVVEGEEVPS